MSRNERHATDARIAEWRMGGLGKGDRQTLEAHLAACHSCSARSQLVGELLATPNDLPVDLEERLSSPSRIDWVLARASNPTPRAAPNWRWPIFAGAAAAFALVMAVIVIRRAPEWPVIVEGSLAQGTESATRGQALKSDGAFAAMEETVIRLPDQSTLRVARGTRLSAAKKGKAWRIDKGLTAFEVKPQRENRFVVETDEAQVTVVGTMFSVERPSIGATVIAVESGRVSVLNRLTGVTSQLDAGGSLRVAKVELPPAPPPPVALLTPPTPIEPEPAPRIQEIRRRIRAGELPKAKALMRRAQKTLHSRIERAELAIVGAEIFLAEKKYRSAVRAYERVVREFSGTVQAESALYAAAQVALDHPETGASGADLLRKYVESYPRGRFRSEADGMLRVLKSR